MIAPVPPSSVAASAEPRPVGLDLRIETPENVVLTYTLAGPTPRAGAYLIDLGLRLLIMTTFGVAVSIAGALLDLSGIATGAALLLWFFLEWGYHTLFEGLWRGRTPGKWLVGLRVIQERGYPITFWAAAGRNLLRFADGLPLIVADRFVPTYAVGLTAMLLSPRFQRLGDLLGRTVVVHERKAAPPRQPVILERIDPLPRESMSGPAPPPRTLSVIDAFLGRRGAVSIARGHELARPLARAVAVRLKFSGERDLVERYPMAFLARVYVTFVGRDDDPPASKIPQRPAALRPADPAAPAPVYDDFVQYLRT